VCYSSHVQFNILNKNLVNFLDEYLYKQISTIPRHLRPVLINKIDLTAQNYLNSFKKNYIENPDKALSIHPDELKQPFIIYETLLSYLNAMGSHSNSQSNFNTRCKLLSSLVPMKDENIKEFLDESTGNFHLLSCIYEIIFNKLSFPGNRRIILNHYYGYSVKYEKLSQMELAEKLNVSQSTIKYAALVLERKVNDIITKFKVLVSHYSYNSKYLLNGELIMITPVMFNCIRRDESADDITTCFVARVFSIIYNYKLIALGSDGKEVYWLIKQGTKNSKINILFYNRIKRKIESSQRTMGNKIISDNLSKLLEEGNDRIREDTQG